MQMQFRTHPALEGTVDTRKEAVDTLHAARAPDLQATPTSSHQYMSWMHSVGLQMGKTTQQTTQKLAGFGIDAWPKPNTPLCRAAAP